MVSRAVAAILIFCSPANVLAADWGYVTTSSSGSDYFIDTSSVKKTSSGYPKRNIVVAWFNIDHSKDNSVVERSTKALYNFDCEAREIAIAHLVAYDPQGRVVNSVNSTYTSFNPAVPDTVGNDLLEKACFISQN